jgi:hypothetical protein
VWSKVWGSNRADRRGRCVWSTVWVSWGELTMFYDIATDSNKVYRFTRKDWHIFFLTLLLPVGHQQLTPSVVFTKSSLYQTKQAYTVKRLTFQSLSN